MRANVDQIAPVDTANPRVVRGPSSVVALSAAGDMRTWADLERDVHNARTRLRASGWLRPLLVCKDRYFTAVSLLAAWAERRVPILPPNGRAEAGSALLNTGEADGSVSDDLAEAWLSQGTDVGPSDGVLVDILERRDDGRLLTLFSSGSTGKPVAIHKTAGQLLGEATTLASLFKLGPEARVLSTAPSHHIYGLLVSVLVPLTSGGAFVRETPLHPTRIAELARGLGARVLCSVPPHLYGLQALSPRELPAMNRVFCSGARLPNELAAALRDRFDMQVTELFGSSETGGIAWKIACKGDDWLPLPGVEVSAEDDGTLLLESPFLDPASARPHRGADRVALVPNGRFRHLGRADGVVKMGGQRVSLLEIERRVLAIPGVTDAAVIALQDNSPRQHEICAAVVAPGLKAQDLRSALAPHLEPVTIPRRIKFVEQLPREVSGKLPRAALASLFQ